MAGLPGETPASLAATVEALKRVAPTATVHPNVYRAYAGVSLEGFNQPVPPSALQALRDANRPEPPLLQRALSLARRKLDTAKPAPRAATTVSVESEQTVPAQTQEKMREREYLLAGSRVFLTGGSGFVGGYVARALVNAGAEVFALLRPGAPPGALAQLPLQLVRGDLTELASWSAALRGCRFCFHVAALYAGPDRAAAMYDVNARATGALLAASAEAGTVRFIHTSTIGTVGRPADGSLPDESTPFNLWESASHYARSKHLGELIAQCWHGTGMDVVIVKPTAPVGAGDGSRERSPSATGRRILAALRGQSFAYPPGGINHAPAQDIAAGHLLAAERGKSGEVYILGHADGNLDRAAFARLLNAPSGKSAPHSGLDALTANPRKAIAELGLPQSDLAAAFAEAVAYYRQDLLEETRERVVVS
jgi:dihydroflavonol-4-reductase